MPGATLRAATVAIHSAHPRELAHFYQRLLGMDLVAEEGPRPGHPPNDGWALLRPPAGQGGLSLGFEFEPEYVPPIWPSVRGEQQVMEHLDIAVDDLAEAVAWALSVGARLADNQPQKDVRVMLDPAGHPFCLFPVHEGNA